MVNNSINQMPKNQKEIIIHLSEIISRQETQFNEQQEINRKLTATLEEYNREPRLTAKQAIQWKEKEPIWKKWGGEIVGGIIAVILAFLLGYFIR